MRFFVSAIALSTALYACSDNEPKAKNSEQDAIAKRIGKTTGTVISEVSNRIPAGINEQMKADVRLDSALAPMELEITQARFSSSGNHELIVSLMGPKVLKEVDPTSSVERTLKIKAFNASDKEIAHVKAIIHVTHDYAESLTVEFPASTDMRLVKYFIIVAE